MEYSELIKRLSEAMVANRFQQLDVSFGGCSCRLVNELPGQNLAREDQECVPIDSGSDPDLETGLTGDEDQSEPFRVTAERVGVFHDAKEPMQVGDDVVSAQTLGVIKGISFQDKVVAPRDGRIACVNIKDGEVVEFGRLMFCLEVEKPGR